MLRSELRIIRFEARTIAHSLIEGSRLLASFPSRRPPTASAVTSSAAMGVTDGATSGALICPSGAFLTFIIGDNSGTPLFKGLNLLCSNDMEASVGLNTQPTLLDEYGPKSNPTGWGYCTTGIASTITYLSNAPLAWAGYIRGFQFSCTSSSENGRSGAAGGGFADVISSATGTYGTYGVVGTTYPYAATSFSCPSNTLVIGADVWVAPFQGSTILSGIQYHCSSIDGPRVSRTLPPSSPPSPP